MKKISRIQIRKNRIRRRLDRQSRGRRLVVARSNRYIMGQIVDLKAGKTLVTVFSKAISSGKKTKTEEAFETGKKLAKKALKKDVKKVIFDRSGYPYHGRIKALAQGAREGGLKF